MSIGNNLRIQSLVAQKSVLQAQLMRNMAYSMQAIRPIRPIRPISFTGHHYAIPNNLELVKQDIRFGSINILISTKLRMIDEEIKSLERLNKNEHKLDIIG